MAKKYTEVVVTCLDCPYYTNVNGNRKTARCGHIDGPISVLKYDEIWGGIIPEECPLEDWE